jgi:hypothetical protein
MDPLYLAGSLAGVAMLVALSAVLFGTRGRIATAESVQTCLALLTPGFQAREIALARDGRAALALNDADDRVHLVVARGDSFAVRRLSPRLVRAVARDGATLSLRLADFTLPRAELCLPDAESASLWERRIREDMR